MASHRMQQRARYYRFSVEYPDGGMAVTGFIGRAPMVTSVVQWRVLPEDPGGPSGVFPTLKEAEEYVANWSENSNNVVFADDDTFELELGDEILAGRIEEDWDDDEERVWIVFIEGEEADRCISRLDAEHFVRTLERVDDTA